MSDRYCIRRIRLALDTDYPRAADLTDRTRRLFHQRIKGLLDTLLQQVSLPGHLLKAEQIVIDLGSLPEAYFEEAFCRRLMRILPEKLYQQLRDESPGMNQPVLAGMTQLVTTGKSKAEAWQEGRYKQPADGGNISPPPEMTRAGKSDNLQAHSGLSVTESGRRIYRAETEKLSLSCYQVVLHYVRTAIWTRDQPPDRWLSEQLTQHSASLSALAGICLQMPQLSLPGRFFRENTLRLLIRKLAPGQFEHQPASPGIVLFAALYWYQCHSAVSVPAFPQRIHWPVMHLSDADPESLLPPITRPELVPWCRALQYRSPSMTSLRDEEAAYLVDGLADSFTEKYSTETDDKTTHSRIENINKLFVSVPDTDMTVRVSPGKDHRVLSSSAAPVPDGADGRQYFSGAGLSLLWPLLPELLQITGIRQQDAEMDEHQRLEAVKLLSYLEEGTVCETIPSTTFNHWLCGVLPEHTQTIVPLSAERAEKVDGWLQALPERIPGWQRLSGQDIRWLFLQRDGWLCHDSHTLYLPPQPADVLLAQWPWPQTILLLPWLKIPLTLSLSLPPQK